MTTELSLYEASITNPQSIIDALGEDCEEEPQAPSLLDTEDDELPIDLSDAFSTGDVLTIAAEGEQEQPHKVTGWFEIDHWKYGKFFIPRLERCV